MALSACAAGEGGAGEGAVVDGGRSSGALLLAAELVAVSTSTGCASVSLLGDCAATVGRSAATFTGGSLSTYPAIGRKTPARLGLSTSHTISKERRTHAHPSRPVLDLILLNRFR